MLPTTAFNFGLDDKIHDTSSELVCVEYLKLMTTRHIVVLNVLQYGRIIPHVRRRSVFKTVQLAKSTSSVVLNQRIAISVSLMIHEKLKGRARRKSS